MQRCPVYNGKLYISVFVSNNCLFSFHSRKTRKNKNLWSRKNDGFIFKLSKCKAVLRIHLILMRIRIQILDPHRKQCIRIQISNFFSIFLLIFYLKLYEPFRNKEIFIISLSFSKVQI